VVFSNARVLSFLLECTKSNSYESVSFRDRVSHRVSSNRIDDLRSHVCLDLSSCQTRKITCLQCVPPLESGSQILCARSLRNTLYPVPYHCISRGDCIAPILSAQREDDHYPSCPEQDHEILNDRHNNTRNLGWAVLTVSIQRYNDVTRCRPESEVEEA
jgi:hypothetical protein